MQKEQEKKQKVELLNQYHEMDWQETENIESGKGMAMEWERVFWNLVEGSSGQHRKRKWRKKPRWTLEARRIRSLGGLVIRREWKKAGRRLETNYKRERIEKVRRKKKEFSENQKQKETKRMEAAWKQQTWKMTWKFKELRIIDNHTEKELKNIREGLEKLCLCSVTDEIGLDSILNNIQDWEEWDSPWPDGGMVIKDLESVMQDLDLNKQDCLVMNNLEDRSRILLGVNVEAQDEVMELNSPEMTENSLLNEKVTDWIDMQESSDSHEDDIFLESFRNLLRVDKDVSGTAMELAGSWDEQNSPFKKETKVMEELQEHDKMDILRNFVGVRDDAKEVLDMDWTEKYFGFGEEYLEHMELDRWLERKPGGHEEVGFGAYGDQETGVGTERVEIF